MMSVKSFSRTKKCQKKKKKGSPSFEEKINQTKYFSSL